MSVYVIADIEVNDWDKYREYVEKTRPIVERYGGRYHIRGGEITVTAGDWKPNRLIVIEFPTKEDMEAFWESPEYEPVSAIRRGASTMISSVVVDGYDGTTDNVG